jgi:transaldolase
MIIESELVQAVQAFVRKDFTYEFGHPKMAVREDPEWRKVRDTGTRLWLDTGDLAEARALWNLEFEALTTNNTLLNKEVQKGIYDGVVREAAAAVLGAVPEIERSRLILEIGFILNAVHGLALVQEFDAHVSVELHTDLAGDVERTVEYGRRYYAICPERFYVKVPLTPAGLLAARELGRQGIPVNLTLGFSARQNYVVALLAQPRYLNVFMGRLNAFVADNSLGTGRNVGEKATLATQRMLNDLRGQGRTKSLLIGASIRDGSQVLSLAGLDVLTLPPKAAQQYRERPAATVPIHLDNDPPVSTSPGIRLEHFAGQTLWDIPDRFKTAMADLLAKGETERLTPVDLHVHFSEAGFGDLFPRWSTDDVRTVTADGKIPRFETWRERLSSGKVGLDSLMNLCALASFASDQQALDQRIQSLL